MFDIKLMALYGIPWACRFTKDNLKLCMARIGKSMTQLCRQEAIHDRVWQIQACSAKDGDGLPLGSGNAFMG